jgi:type IV pilus assembly protein PilA
MTARNIIKNQKGFTLIELLVVIGILAVLLAITLIAINPQRQFAQANNTRRASDVNAILNAVGQYSADNHGNITALGLTNTPTLMGKAAGEINFCTLVVPTYIAALPVDPQSGAWTDCTAYETGYKISVDSSGTGRVTVSAPTTELGLPAITVTR